MKIWALFSIKNNYDQPENNLVAWWVNKPSFEVLANAIGVEVDHEIGNEKVGRILKGQQSCIFETYYRLDHIKEGLIE